LLHKIDQDPKLKQKWIKGVISCDAKTLGARFVRVHSI